MKKNFLIIIFSFFLNISVVFALENEFIIDVDKININAKGNILIDGLDSTYNIETDGFSKAEEVNEGAKEYTKKLLELTLGDDDLNERGRAMLRECYISTDNGFDTLSAYAFINSFIENVASKNISYEYLKVIRTIEFEHGIITLSYFPNATVDGEKTDLMLLYYLKVVDGEYKLFMPWFTTGDDLEQYFYDIASSEDKGDIIGGTYKSISLEEDKMANEKLTDEYLNEIYVNNKDYNVSISAVSDGAVSSYGSGFFIREGVVVTTWSLFLNALNTGEFVYVNDSNGNAYKVDGVIAADTSYDVVILKLEEEVGKGVIFGDSMKLVANDYLFTINSKNNTTFSINYGTYISQNMGRLKNMFAISSSDQGSALYNKDGEVVGFNTVSSINSDISNANSTDYLKELQNILLNKDFTKIKSTKISLFKDKYYYGISEEKKVNNIPDKVWNKFKEVGAIEDNISLELIKGSYKDGILSLRYKNSAIESLETLYLTKNYESKLIEQGFKLTYETTDKLVYENNKYEVIIKENLDYLIIIMMEK